MDNRQKRLHEVYEYVHYHNQIHTKKDMADALGQSYPAMYSAFNGNELYLTNSLFKRICAAFPDTFNLNYLLNGEGELLQRPDTSMASEEPAGYSTQPLPLWADTLISIMSKQIKENEALHSELRQTLSEVRTLKNDLQTLISTLKSH